MVVICGHSSGVHHWTWCITILPSFPVKIASKTVNNVALTGVNNHPFPTNGMKKFCIDTPTRLWMHGGDLVGFTHLVMQLSSLRHVCMDQKCFQCVWVLSRTSWFQSCHCHIYLLHVPGSGAKRPTSHLHAAPSNLVNFSHGAHNRHVWEPLLIQSWYWN